MTLEDLNSHPVNQKARRMLEEIGEQPDPTSLHCVQLALWGIEKRGLEAQPMLAETTSAMAGWSPERLVNFLLPGRPDAQISPPGWESASEPLSLARCILEEIEEKMMAHFPWYGHLE
jgi:hypothetical protein